MDIIQDSSDTHPSFTELKDRILWIDGDSTFSMEELTKALLKYNLDLNKVYVDHITKDVAQFNLYSSTKISKKTSIKHLSAEWTYPEKYKHLDIEKYIYLKFISHVEKTSFTADKVKKRLARIDTELRLFKEYHLYDLLKAIIYIVDEFEKNQVIWGTGRGSSCASYILYLIGLHEVDSVEYDLSLDEFFR